MKQKKFIIAGSSLVVILLLAYLILNKSMGPDSQSPSQSNISEPTQSLLPISATPTTSPEVQSMAPAIENPSSPNPEPIIPKPLLAQPEEPTEPSKPTAQSSEPKSVSKINPKSKKPAHKHEKQLMEFVTEDSNLDNEEDEPVDPAEQKNPETMLAVQKATDTIEELMKDAKLIVNGFEETDTDELNGTWEGNVKISNGTLAPIIINRIWDHMTDDYLATSCFGIHHGGKTHSGYLRLKTLSFFEKLENTSSKLLIKLQDKYLFEIKAPSSGKRSTTGQAYEIRKKQLVPLGMITLRKDPDATADRDCDLTD